MTSGVGFCGGLVRLPPGALCDVSGHRNGPDLHCAGSGHVFLAAPRGSSGGLVVASWVDDEVAEDLAGGGVDDGDVEVLGEQDDVGSDVGSPDADVAERSATRRVTLPAVSMRSWRTRSWVSRLRSLLGAAFGRSGGSAVRKSGGRTRAKSKSTRAAGANSPEPSYT